MPNKRAMYRVVAGLQDPQRSYVGDGWASCR